ncbi:MAG: anti-sigma regulatory factor [Peptostreptococcaceae bacterium]|nr:anti-sigma regulatory factor [Peptostreptococcaceae bacterium]
MAETEKTIKLEYEVGKEEFSKAGIASSNIKKVLNQIGIDSTIVRRVAIAAYESEINIVIHSEGGKIIAEISHDRIIIVAHDKGKGIENIENAMTKGFSTASNEAREMGFGAGMGLPNMKRTSDQFSIESSKGSDTIVEMIFNI